MSGCNALVSDQPNLNREGFYEIVFDLGEVQCPTRWEISKEGVTIINGEERIQVSDFQTSEDSASFTLPVFGTTVDYHFTTADSFQGFFRNQFRTGDYNVAFTGTKKNLNTPLKRPQASRATYDVTMDLNKDPYKAIGVFNFNNEKVTGTFLTETGDYRFLEGEMTSENKFYLSCFDGSHLFYFSASMKKDSILGTFYSGNHWNTTWSGLKDESISLINPDSLTYLNRGETSVEFSGVNMNQDTVRFNSLSFDRVSMIQILGTWCPNCMDETRYYTELSNKHGNDLTIIGLAFERPGNLASQLKNINTFKKALGVDYPIYLSGKANKSEASKMFNTLNGISSFPTTIFLDKRGMVRKIHTGFYGPGTGDYYTEYTKDTEAFLEALINEEY